MPILKDYQLPSSPAKLTAPSADKSIFFLAFISSIDPVTNHSWCPDVRAALPVIDAAFSSDSAPELVYVEVGQRPE
jgi:hypothetical protein